jgi:hypothetical protein
MQRHQAQRFAALIMEADTVGRLKEVLRQISDAHLPEELFSDLYVLLRKRAHDIAEVDRAERGKG